MDIPEGHSRRRRHLPHHEDPGNTYFLTFRLKERGICDLSRDDIAPIIIGALHHFANRRYYLFEHTVMPDHVHVLLRPIRRDGRCEPLWQITHSIKSWTANQINRVLGRRGALWLDETYDHSIRNERDRTEKANYILTNPIRSGLVTRLEDWPWYGVGPEPIVEDS